MVGRLQYNSSTSPFIILRQGDFVSVGELLTAAGVDLDHVREDTSESLRYAGINVLVYIEYVQV